ncbi:MAG: phosphatidate cytidylyltransferase [Arcticibacter sp.]
MTDLKQRAVTAIFFAGFVVSCIMANQWTFLVLMALLLVLGILEFYRLISLSGNAPQAVMGLLIGVVFCALTYLISVGLLAVESLTILLPLTFMVFLFELYRKQANPFLNIASTLIGVVYLAIPVSMMIVMALMPSKESGVSYHGGLLMGCILHIWANDTGAYFVGSRFGKNRLFERISPKKSWEGFFGGLALSIVAAWLNHRLFAELELIEWIAVGVLMSVFGTLGDLVESMLKRSINIKDSGTIFPGHGGILDRFDALLVGIPFVCCYLWLVGHFS